jgi:hypothetical protein
LLLALTLREEVDSNAARGKHDPLFEGIAHGGGDEMHVVSLDEVEMTWKNKLCLPQTWRPPQFVLPPLLSNVPRAATEEPDVVWLKSLLMYSTKQSVSSNAQMGTHQREGRRKHLTGHWPEQQRLRAKRRLSFKATGKRHPIPARKGFAVIQCYE